METNSIGSDGTDELLTSLDPLLDQSNQLVLESSRDDKSFASTFRSSSRQETVRTNDSKSSDGRQSKLQHDCESPRFDPRHATVAEILERTDRQLKALSAARKSNFDSAPPAKPPGPRRDQKPQSRKSASAAIAAFPSLAAAAADGAAAAAAVRKATPVSRWSQPQPQPPPQEIVISRPALTRSSSLREAMDWNNAREDASYKPSYLQHLEENRHPSLYHQREESHKSYLQHREDDRHSSSLYQPREDTHHVSSENELPSSYHHREDGHKYYLQHREENRHSSSLFQPRDDTHHVNSFEKQQPSFQPHIYSEPPALLKKSVAEDPLLRQRLYDAERKVSELQREVEGLLEKNGRKDDLLQQMDKNFADVLLKSKGRESEKEESIMELRGQLSAVQEQAGAARRDLARLEALLAEAEQRLRQKDEAAAALMGEAQEARRRGAEEVNRLRDELEIESSRKSDLLRRNQATHEEKIKLAKSLAAAEKALEEHRLDASYKESERQSRAEKLAGELARLDETTRQQEAVIGDLQRALRLAQGELERWKEREVAWAEAKAALAAQADARGAEAEMAAKRREAELRAQHEKDRSEERAAAEVAKSQSEQRLRAAHRDEIHALGARHQKELAQFRARADEELARRAAAAEETARGLRSELAAARERAEYYRLKGCESEAQRLRTLSQMQSLMQASCSQALSVLSKPPAAAAAAPAAFELPPTPTRTVLEAVQELPALEPGDGLDIIDSLVVNGAGGSRPPSSVDLILLGSEKTASPAPP